MQEKRKRRPGGGRKPTPGEKRKIVAIRMLPSLKRQLEQAAQANKRSFTAELEFRAAKPAQATPLRPAHITALGDVVMILAALVENPAPAPEGEQPVAGAGSRIGDLPTHHAGAGSWLTPKGGIALRAALDRVLQYLSPSLAHLGEHIEPEGIGHSEANKLVDALKLQKQITQARSAFEALQGFLSFQNRR
jgi:hypothetical protein